MTLLRAASRTMLASYFIVSGVKALRDPDALVPAAEPLADKVVPLVKQYAPDQVADYVPEDARTLVRINGAAQVLGGLALASGKGRRVGATLLAGSLVPSTIAKHPFWSERDPELKAQQRSHFLKNVSLLGGVLLASRDTEGRPGVVWRAQKGGQSLVRDTRKVTKKLGKSSGGLTDTASDLADGALAGGAAIVGTVLKSTRKTRKRAAKQIQAATALAAKQVAEHNKASQKAAKQAKKDAPKRRRAEKKAAVAKAAEARQAAKVAQQQERAQRVADKQALAAAAIAEKQALETAKAVAKQNRAQLKIDKKARRVEGHVVRGEN